MEKFRTTIGTALHQSTTGTRWFRKPMEVV
jgi:hypothetical protein